MADATTRILVQEEPFDVGAEVRRAGSASPEIGAVASFVGLVRDINEGDEVAGLFLEHYPGMTEKQIAAIVDEASARWDVRAATVIHRVGRLAPSEQIVFVAIGSGHRRDAFQACEFVMDYLKTRATFWKKEQTSDGMRWLTTRQSDLDSARAWEGKGPSR